MPEFTRAAIVRAIPTLQSLAGVSVPVSPLQVAEALEELLIALVEQGYEVQGITPVPGALLCTAFRCEADIPAARGAETPGTREPTPHLYGCEGLTCAPGRHTLDCPQLALEDAAARRHRSCV